MFEDIFGDSPNLEPIRSTDALQNLGTYSSSTPEPVAVQPAAPVAAAPISSSVPSSPAKTGGSRLQDVLTGDVASWAVPLGGALLSAMHPVGARAVQGANAGLQITDRYRRAAEQDARDKALSQQILKGVDGTRTVSKRVPVGQQGFTQGAYGAAGEEGPFVPPEVAASNPAFNRVETTTEPQYSDAEKRLIQLYAEYNPKAAAEFVGKLQMERSKPRPLHVIANPELGVLTTDQITGETIQRAPGTPKETTTTNKVDAGTHWVLETLDKRTGRVIDQRKVQKEATELEKADLANKGVQNRLNEARIGEVGSRVAVDRSQIDVNRKRADKIEEEIKKARDPENLTKMTIGQLGSALGAARGQAKDAESKEDRALGALAARNITRELASRTSGKLPEGVPTGSTVVGKTKDGKGTVYKTPQGKQLVAE